MTVTTLEVLEKEITSCRKCPRLVAWREEVGRAKRRAYRGDEYWAKPVPGFGDLHARVLVVGLAPGAHGSNRTGRMFTGDASGDFLYPALFRAGFASQPFAKNANDDMELKDIFITALCRCVPPGNKPTPAEMNNCRPYLQQEMKLLQEVVGIVALGKLAYEAVTRHILLLDKAESIPGFSHGVFLRSYEGAPWVIGSYHPSRQNTQTGRLTAEMFDQIWKQVNQLLGK
ncbi:MAG: uracil-DNA glycosylase [Anaerolineaceae bacterium]|nr:uracil-DNA glycosylase [Anaerolineaceae bacterium]